jgi:Family of unknown function (DUF6134)
MRAVSVWTSRKRKAGRIAKASLALAAALLVAIPSLAFGGDAGEYTFTVLSDGRPIGRHLIAFEHEGDRVEIREVTEIEVSFATIPLYTFEHHAHQLWQDGRAVRIDATTNDNGEKLDITVRDTDQGYVRTINGRVERFDPSATVLALWNKETFDHDAFISSVEDKVLNASFDYVGAEKIVLAGQRVPTQHYRMLGDEEHELWFDMAGHLAKVAFRRYGSTIEYVRDQVEPRDPRSACAATC